MEYRVEINEITNENRLFYSDFITTELDKTNEIIDVINGLMCKTGYKMSPNLNKIFDIIIDVGEILNEQKMHLKDFTNDSNVQLVYFIAYVKIDSIEKPFGSIFLWKNPDENFVFIQGIVKFPIYHLNEELVSEIILSNKLDEQDKIFVQRKYKSLNEILISAVENYTKTLNINEIDCVPYEHQAKILKKYHGFIKRAFDPERLWKLCTHMSPMQQYVKILDGTLPNTPKDIEVRNEYEEFINIVEKVDKITDIERKRNVLNIIIEFMKKNFYKDSLRVYDEEITERLKKIELYNEIVHENLINSPSYKLKQLLLGGINIDDV